MKIHHSLTTECPADVAIILWLHSLHKPMVCCLLGEAPAATGLHSRNAWGRQLPGMCNAKPKRKGVLESGLLRGTDSASLAIGEAAKPHALCAGDTRRLGRQGIAGLRGSRVSGGGQEED